MASTSHDETHPSSYTESSSTPSIASASTSTSPTDTIYSSSDPSHIKTSSLRRLSTDSPSTEQKLNSTLTRKRSISDAGSPTFTSVLPQPATDSRILDLRREDSSSSLSTTTDSCSIDTPRGRARRLSFPMLMSKIPRKLSLRKSKRIKIVASRLERCSIHASAVPYQYRKNAKLHAESSNTFLWNSLFHSELAAGISMNTEEEEEAKAKKKRRHSSFRTLSSKIKDKLTQSHKDELSDFTSLGDTTRVTPVNSSHKSLTRRQTISLGSRELESMLLQSLELREGSLTKAKPERGKLTKIQSFSSSAKKRSTPSPHRKYSSVRGMDIETMATFALDSEDDTEKEVELDELAEFSESENGSRRSSQVSKHMDELPAQLETMSQELLTVLIHKAAVVGDVEKIQRLLDCNPHITVNQLRDSVDHSTPLHKAAGSNQVGAMRVLLEMGANIEATDNLGATPLFFACGNDCAEATAFLMAKNAKANIRETYGYAPLHICMKKGHLKAAEQLLVFKADVNIRQGTSGNTALHMSSQTGNVAAVQLLLNRPDIGVDVTNNNGESPLHLAIIHNHSEVVEELLDKRPEAARKYNNMDQSPLHLAACHGLNEILLILSANLSGPVLKQMLNETDINGNTPLHLAVLNKHLSTVELLASSSEVDLDVQNNEGNAPIHIALALLSNELDYAKVLFGAGCNMYIKNSERDSPKKICRAIGIKLRFEEAMRQ